MTTHPSKQIFHVLFIIINLEFGFVCSTLNDISEQGKTSSFMMKPSLNNQNKHVPTIKIKPVVRKSRMNSSMAKHQKSPDNDVS